MDKAKKLLIPLIPVTIILTILLANLIYKQNVAKKLSSKCNSIIIGKTTSFGLKAEDIKLIDKEISLSDLYSTNTTIQQKLADLNATCKNGLPYIDNKEVAIYSENGCWGNPPATLDLILSKQNENIDKLHKQFYVLEIPCNLSKAPIQ